MIELLRRAELARTAIVTDEHTVSYGELVSRAEAIAAGLAGHRISRFGALDHDAATVVAVMAGASLAGAESCQYPPVEEAGEVEALAERFDHPLVLSARPELAGRVATLTAAELSAGRCSS